MSQQVAMDEKVSELSEGPELDWEKELDQDPEFQARLDNLRDLVITLMERTGR